MSAGTAHGVRPALRSEAAVAVGTLGSQACVYALSVLSTRSLGSAEYSELASLLTLTVIASIPAMALQSWTARTLVGGADARAALATASRLALISSLATLVSVLALARRLDVDPVPSAAACALLVATLVWLAVAQGYLQGHHRLGALALVIGTAGAGRLIGGAGGLEAHIGTWAVVWGVGLGTLMAAGLGWALVLRDASLGRAERSWRPVLRIATATGGLWLLANLDVLLARLVLPAHDAGQYAAGALIARAVQFAPQFVVVSSFALLADVATSRRALRTAAVKTTVIGGAAVGLLAVVGPWLVPAVLGAEFTDAGRLSWAFALLGLVLALDQLLVAQRVARHDEAVAAGVWAASGVLIGAAELLVAREGQLLFAGLLVSGALAVGLVVRGLRVP